MTADTATSRSLACLEIWGGNCAVQEALELPGLSAWVSMVPDPGIAIPYPCGKQFPCRLGRRPSTFQEPRGFD